MAVSVIARVGGYKKSSYATGPQLNSYVIISIMCGATYIN